MSSIAGAVSDRIQRSTGKVQVNADGTITATGFVGLGTGATAPIAPLEVRSTQATGLRMIRDGGQMAITYRVYGTSSFHGGYFECSRAKGTELAPAVPVDADTLFQIGAGGFDGGTPGVFYSDNVRMVMSAAGTFSETSNPTRIEFLTTPASSLTATSRFRIESTGSVQIRSNGWLSIVGIAGNPSSPVAGDLWYNTTQKSHRFQNTAAIQGLVGLIYVNTADDALASGGTAELKFASQIALTAAGLTTGKAIRVKISGTVTTDATASQTAVVNIKLGDATNATSGTTVATTRFALTSGLTNANWSVEATMVIRSATTAWGAGFGMIGSTVAAPWTAAIVAVSNGGGVGTVTTIPNISTAHTVHATGTPNDTGMTITLRTMTVELLD